MHISTLSAGSPRALSLFTPLMRSMPWFQYFTLLRSSSVATPSGRLSIMFSLNSFIRASSRLAEASSWRESLRLLPTSLTELRSSSLSSSVCGRRSLSTTLAMAEPIIPESARLASSLSIMRSERVSASLSTLRLVMKPSTMFLAPSSPTNSTRMSSMSSRELAAEPTAGENLSTNISAWCSSSASCRVKMETPAYKTTLKKSPQNSEWVQGSRPVSPKSASGFIILEFSMKPNAPSASIRPVRMNIGIRSV